MSRLKAGLAAEPAELLGAHVHDETIRFGILIVDGRTRVVQPCPPRSRGVDSPAFVMNDDHALDRPCVPLTWNLSPHFGRYGALS
ncbi:DUF5919 domain-containing protein [Streptosporangium sandarakinum]|uniref:DUF5919 domain-containing protein n=1 Tax=Streptosporangium sandarakinum TaxID=1260955 RepID=UPI0034139AA9